MIVVLFFRQGIMGERELSDCFENGGERPSGRGRRGLSENLLHLENVTMQFGGVVAVNDVSMDCATARSSR
jgi:hypothetical protein